MTRDTLSIDRFATQANTMLPQYNSLFYETDCSGIDAFA
jgi:hypothetical protein